MTYNDYATICKALGDETRVKIFDMLKCGNMCACKILDEFNCTQPTLSYHMNKLCDCGLVVAEKQGKWMHYSINVSVLADLSSFLSLDKTQVNQPQQDCCGR